ncbi:MAG: hypothetical protein J3R72DRAFT_449041 [Linnemannia gamsii]|nr:MAG: hypothetical protein J3R72DRAFT_449041 [Linnemannia gamsii]
MGILYSANLGTVQARSHSFCPMFLLLCWAMSTTMSTFSHLSFSSLSQPTKPLFKASFLNSCFRVNTRKKNACGVCSIVYGTHIEFPLENKPCSERRAGELWLIAHSCFAYFFHTLINTLPIIFSFTAPLHDGWGGTFSVVMKA